VLRRRPSTRPGHLSDVVVGRYGPDIAIARRLAGLSRLRNEAVPQPGDVMTRMAMFSAKAYDHRSFDAANVDGRVKIEYHEPRLDSSTAGYAAGATVVCAFVNDDLSSRVLEALAGHGVRPLT